MDLIQQKMSKRLQTTGLKMMKILSHGGIFTSGTYDHRTAHTNEELHKLNAEGFMVNEDMGAWLFNALI